jgi:hypothetical protein
MAETEPRGDVVLRASRSAEAIWEFWACSSRDILEDGGIPAAWSGTVRQAGADFLIAGLKDLGLTRFLGGSKLTQLGFTYAQAGAWLRLTQTSALDDELFEETVLRVRQNAGRPWPWGAYPV